MTGTSPSWGDLTWDLSHTSCNNYAESWCSLEQVSWLTWRKCPVTDYFIKPSSVASVYIAKWNTTWRINTLISVIIINIIKNFKFLSLVTPWSRSFIFNFFHFMYSLFITIHLDLQLFQKKKTKKIKKLKKNAKNLWFMSHCDFVSYFVIFCSSNLINTFRR